MTAIELGTAATARVEKTGPAGRPRTMSTPWMRMRLRHADGTSEVLEPGRDYIDPEHAVVRANPHGFQTVEMSTRGKRTAEMERLTFEAREIRQQLKDMGGSTKTKSTRLYGERPKSWRL